MVDFRKLREAKAQPTPIHPIDIFRRLPKPPGINDLYTSQAQVLEEWHERRKERDVVIKLHTGGGKTLVGLLVAQSVMNESHEAVIYLAPTVQLVEQALAKAEEYSIPATPYIKGTDFPDTFLTGKSVMICVYQALFNGQSRFGVRGGTKEIVHPAAIILDDAHVAFSTVRDCFTLKVEKGRDQEGYAQLTNMFRKDFEGLGKLGTFDDVVSGEDYGILDIPYWSWKIRSKQVQEYLRANGKDYGLVWPFLRDALDYCHAFISRDAFVITPILPLMNMIPTFSECPRRIYMSATISDDSALIRAFDADPDSVKKPITSKSLAGVSERMILIPELSKIKDVSDTVHALVKHMTGKIGAGIVILTPSGASANTWLDVAIYADSSERVSASINELLKGSKGPYVFANRYDGIDLPGDACRLLIMSGSPRGASEYDLYRANVLYGGSAINALQAQRIEQGMGRAARGAGDHCVVIATGSDLVGWLSHSKNHKFLTAGTRAQIEMGIEVSKSVSNARELLDTINRCLRRDKEWIEYHAETLATLTEVGGIDQKQIDASAVERKAFKLAIDGYFEKAINKLQKFCEDDASAQAPKQDKMTISWLRQLSARFAHYWGNDDLSLELQQRAYALNNNLLRPRIASPYTPHPMPGLQAESIVANVAEYKFRKGYPSSFNEVTSHIVPEASSNQFEQSLSDLGRALGFITERPDNSRGIGPDVLWLMPGKIALVIEAKSHKKHKNPYTKDDHGQLLNAIEWFKKNYPDWAHVGVSVHPTAKATKATVTVNSKALTFDNLNELITEARDMITQLCESSVPQEELILRCEKLLSKSSLKPDALIVKYLKPFT
jgi:replicative superfamily II helicase